MTAVLLHFGLPGTLILILPVMVTALVLVYHLSEFSSLDRLKKKNTTIAAAGMA